ncbi:hypothetical protein GCM10007906_01150 [Vibrio hyugaensis]|uniref:Uncharacterized protein n=1 Tax=Vibrio hyugaensis TaxID=1534743 RepID=A0ABQ5XWJ1_9VIBR|nr:hypothetical protein GCM10007906_01150 [Vibrio hyugaensis]
MIAMQPHVELMLLHIAPPLQDPLSLVTVLITFELTTSRNLNHLRQQLKIPYIGMTYSVGNSSRM